MDRFATLRRGLVACWCPSIVGGGYLVPDVVSGRRLQSQVVAGTVVGGRKCLQTTTSTGASTGFNVGGLLDFTCCFWFYQSVSDASAYRRHLDALFNTGFWMGGGPEGTQSGFGGGISQTSSPFGLYVKLPIAMWNFIAMSRSGSVQTVIGYGGDGIVVSATQSCTTNALAANALTIGNANVTFAGGMDDLRIYDRALTTAETAILASRPGIGLLPTRHRRPNALGSQFWLRDAGTWKKATGWIKVNGVWTKSTPKISVGGVWK